VAEEDLEVKEACSEDCFEAEDDRKEDLEAVERREERDVETSAWRD
jgi:hypothetical protein